MSDYDCTKPGIEINGKPVEVDFSDLKDVIQDIIEEEHDSPFEWWRPVQERWYKVKPADLKAGMVVRVKKRAFLLLWLNAYKFHHSPGEKNVWMVLCLEHLEGKKDFIAGKSHAVQELDMSPYLNKAKEGE